MASASSPSVLIFEPSLSGHRANYVAAQTEELLKLGADVSLAVPEDAVEQPEGKVFLSDILPQTRHIPLPMISNHLSAFAVANAKLGLLRDAVSKCRPEHCFVPYADGLSQAWGMKAKPRAIFPPEMQIEGLVMREAYAYPTNSWKKRLTATASMHCQRRAAWTCLHHLDPLGFNRTRNLKSKPEKHCLIPEIIERHPSLEASDSKRQLGLDVDRYLVACPGAVNISKGSNLLIDAVLGIEESLGVQLILFGKRSKAIKEKLQGTENDSRTISIDRFASSEEFELLFSAANMIAVCYPRHVGSASILLRAAAAEKEIIASDWGWIGWATKTFNLGKTCDATSVDSIRNQIVQAVNSSRAVPQQNDTRGAKALLSYHTKENHLAHWTHNFRLRHGLTAAKRIGFDEVLEKAN